MHIACSHSRGNIITKKEMTKAKCSSNRYSLMVKYIKDICDQKRRVEERFVSRWLVAQGLIVPPNFRVLHLILWMSILKQQQNYERALVRIKKMKRGKYLNATYFSSKCVTWLHISIAGVIWMTLYTNVCILIPPTGQLNTFLRQLKKIRFFPVQYLTRDNWASAATL